MSGLAGLSRGTRVPICPGAFCVPWDRDRDRSLRDERDRDKFSWDCPAWLSRGTSGTGTEIRGTVPSRPLPIPGTGVLLAPTPVYFFKFLTLIFARHNGYAADAKHPTDLDTSKLSQTKIDPTGKYVLTTRCRTGRSVRGFLLPPVISFEERRELGWPRKYY